MQKIRYSGDPINDAIKEMNYAQKWIAERTAKKMHDKLLLTYKRIIDDFYGSFQPVQYVRHGMEDEWHPGTINGRKVKVYPAAGKNLYLGADQKFDPRTTTGDIDGSLKFAPWQMDSSGYSLGDDAGTVLDYVLNGWRFPYNDISNVFMAVIEDEDLGELYGEPYNILEKISKNEMLINKFYQQAINECKHENNFLYINID